MCLFYILSFSPECGKTLALISEYKLSNSLEAPDGFIQSIFYKRFDSFSL